MWNFYSRPFGFDLALFPAKNNPNSTNTYRIFPGKESIDRALILTYLDSPIVEVSPHFTFLFYFGHLQGELEGQSWTKRANFEFVLFP